MARVVLRKPRVLLLDAVTRHLTRSAERRLLRRLWADVAELETAVVVTDRVSEVVKADKVLVMHRGEVLGCSQHVRACCCCCCCCCCCWWWWCW